METTLSTTNDTEKTRELAEAELNTVSGGFEYTERTHDARDKKLCS